MDKETTYPIKIKINSGILKLNIKKPHLPNGTCKNCGAKISWLKLFGGRNMQVNHIKDNEYMAHSMLCPTVIAYKDKMRKIKNNKKL